MFNSMELGHEHVHYFSFVPATDEWRQWVDGRISDVTELLGTAYGTRDNGPASHLERICVSEPYIFAATLGADGRLVGFFYLHREGKHGAIGVDPAAQRRGIGTALLRAGLKAVPDQWAEVAVSEDRYSTLLTRAGFIAAQSQQDVLTLLGPLLAPLVSGWSLTGDGLTYARASFSGRHGVAWYRLFSIGRPEPRVVNDGRYYVAPYPPSPSFED